MGSCSFKKSVIPPLPNIYVCLPACLYLCRSFRIYEQNISRILFIDDSVFRLVAFLKSQWRIQAVWKTIYQVWHPNSRPKDTSSFLFLVAFQQKWWIISINDYAMHLIISKWLRIQKCIQKIKKYKTKRAKQKKKLSTKVL